MRGLAHAVETFEIDRARLGEVRKKISEARVCVYPHAHRNRSVTKHVSRATFCLVIASAEPIAVPDVILFGRRPSNGFPVGIDP